MMFISVLLPQPDGPTSTRNSPSASPIEMSCRICVGAEALLDVDQVQCRHAIHPLTEPAIRPRTKYLPDST